MPQLLGSVEKGGRGCTLGHKEGVVIFRRRLGAGIIGLMCENMCDGKSY